MTTYLRAILICLGLAVGILISYLIEGAETRIVVTHASVVVLLALCAVPGLLRHFTGP